MPFLRKITGSNHDHSRSESGGSNKISGQVPSLTPHLSNRSHMTADVSPTSSKSMHFYINTPHSRTSSKDIATPDLSLNNRSEAPSPNPNTTSLGRRKKPPQLSLDHMPATSNSYSNGTTSKNSARSSIVSNMSGLSNLNEEEIDTFNHDTATMTNVASSSSTHTATKRISTNGSSTLSDNLTLFTIPMDNHNNNAPNFTPILTSNNTSSTFNSNISSHGDIYSTPIGSSNSNSNSNSRKSSGGNSSNTLSFDKLILSWDPTDPEEWTSQRVIAWLKFHEFPDQWASFFKKYHLYGNNFIKLLAYDNFHIYERQLTQNKMGSYTRFQDLLKKTMTKNVNNNHHIRKQSLDKTHTNIPKPSFSNSSRSSSDSLTKRKSKSLIHEENNKSTTNNGRSTSDYIVSPNKISRSYQNIPTHEEKNKNIPIRSHQKTKSASALYRRSFISLRGPSASSTTTNGSSTNQVPNNSSSSSHNNQIKLNIPQRPLSTLETSGCTTSSTSYSNHNSLTPSKSNTSPLSPGIFRRHHKSSSSESSLLNVIFGSSLSTPTNSNSNGTPPNHNKVGMRIDNDKTPTHKSFHSSHNSNGSGNSHSNTNHHHTSSHGTTFQHPHVDRNSNHKKRHSISNDNLINPRSQSNTVSLNETTHNDISSNMLRPSKTEEKETLWDKFKRRSQIGMGYSTTNSTVSTPSTIHPVTTIANVTASNKSNSSLVTLTSSNIDNASVKISPHTDATQKKKKIDNITSTTPSKQDKTNLNTPLKPIESKGLNNTTKKNKKPSISMEIPKSPFQHYFPIIPKTSNAQPEDGQFILITKDSKSYVPINIKDIKDIQVLKTTIFDKLSIRNDPYPGNSNNNLIIHMSDFNNNLGPIIPEPVLESILRFGFKNTTMKFFIKEPMKLSGRTRASTFTNDSHQQLRSVRSRNSVRSVASSIVTDDVSIITSSSDVTSSEEHAAEIGRRYPQTPSIYYDTVGTSGNNDEELNYWNIKEHLPPENVQKQMVQNAVQMENERNASSSSHLQATPPRKNSKSSFQVIMRDDGKEIDFNKRRESPYVIPELAPKREAPKPPTNISPPRTLSHYKSAPHLRRTTSKIHRKPVPPSTLVGSYTPGSTQVMVPQPYKGATDIERKLKSDDDDVILNPVSNFMLKQRINRSNSSSSQNHTTYGSSPFLKRGASRRIVSSASAADVFEENDITFKDAPVLSEDDDDGSDSSSDDIIWSNKVSKTQEKESTNDKPSLSVNTKKDPASKKSIAEDDNIKTTEAKKTETKENKLTRKMTLRPSPEEVYENLEKFFPHAYLDKPIVEKLMTPNSPKPPPFSAPKDAESKNADDTVIPVGLPTGHHLPRRTRTIRTIAHEANQARKKSMKLKRQNTKMWGTRTVEVTEKQLVAINKSKNSRGQYKEFAWMKGEMIGKGSFGAVYLCLNLTTGEMMAVKQVEVPKYSSQNQTILDMVEALKSEVNTLKDLDHLNIVQYLGFEEKQNIYSLFLEYVAGGSVGSLIRLYGRFDDTLIRHLTIQVLRGLAYLHSRGILHRDMKADNLLLDQDGVCKISDFGISRKSKDIYSNSDMTMRGTVFWMAPEMVDTKQGYSAKVDIWSLGCVVLEMFAGKRPWSNFEVVAAMFKIGKSKSAPPIPEDTLPLISDEGKNFLDACFEIDPEKRPTADKLLSHPFSKIVSSFDFKKTELAKFIKSNDKLNSSKLRVTSQENIQKNN